MYADTMTGSMDRAITETRRRRAIQDQYNRENGIVPKTVVKGIRDVIDIGLSEEKDKSRGRGKAAKADKPLTKAEREQLIERLTAEMKDAARRLEFEQAAFLRDKIRELKVSK